MKGSSFRRPCPPSMVRIIKSFDHSDLDRFVSHDEANQMLMQRRIKIARLGPEYPNSYREVHASIHT